MKCVYQFNTNALLYFHAFQCFRGLGSIWIKMNSGTKWVTQYCISYRNLSFVLLWKTIDWLLYEMQHWIEIFIFVFIITAIAFIIYIFKVFCLLLALWILQDRFSVMAFVGWLICYGDLVLRRWFRVMLFGRAFHKIYWRSILGADFLVVCVRMFILPMEGKNYFMCYELFSRVVWFFSFRLFQFSLPGR